MNAAPFVRDSFNDRDLTDVVSLEGSILLVPQKHPTLVRTAVQINSISRRKELVRFAVPAEKDENRFSTSLQMLAQGTARLVPEYVNIRHRVRRRGKRFLVDDLGKLDRGAFKRILKDGGYKAAPLSTIHATAVWSLYAASRGQRSRYRHTRLSLRPSFFRSPIAWRSPIG